MPPILNLQILQTKVTIININIMDEMVIITDPYEVLDCLAGCPSGSYSKDVEIVQQFRKTFSISTYEDAMQMLEQP